MSNRDRNRKRNRDRRNNRKRLDPMRERERETWGEHTGDQRVTAALGPKPRAWTWQQYHATAAVAPWAIDDRRALAARRSHAPAALTARQYVRPRVDLAPAARDALANAHRQLRAGRINPAEYREYLYRLNIGIVSQEIK